LSQEQINQWSKLYGRQIILEVMAQNGTVKMSLRHEYRKFKWKLFGKAALAKRCVFMTMVAACLFDEGAVLISDSRATKTNNAQYEFSDTLQKIIPIRKNIALAYAGDVQIAGDVAREIRLRIIGNDNQKEPQVLASTLPSIARGLYLKHAIIRRRYSDIYLMMAGVDSLKQIHVYVFKSPLFKPTKIEKGYDVIGSGDIVKPYLRDRFNEIDKSTNSLKSKADALIVGLESELQKHDIGFTVGGLFQTILITP
jgi:20S proteasome alpha/beta subunit